MALKRLEKALEQCFSTGNSEVLDVAVDGYLNEFEEISSTNSSRLHELLFKTWTSLNTREVNLEKDPDYTLSPASSMTVDGHYIVSGAAMNTSTTATVMFMDALLRLGPCLINLNDLNEWWREMAPLAINSTGNPLELANLAQKFVSGVLTSSFYIYSDPSLTDHFAKIAASYGQKVLEIFVRKWFPPDSVNKKFRESQITDEHRRFVMLNCRTLFGSYARKYNKTAFTQINKYFVDPDFRVKILDLIVEYLSESQNSKLFLIYESPFFESLLVCLERDSSHLVLQLAITVLSMLLVHICDKLVPTGVLFRVYAIFGRVCSWQRQPLSWDEDKQKSDEVDQAAKSDASKNEEAKENDEELAGNVPKLSKNIDKKPAVSNYQWSSLTADPYDSMVTEGELEAEVSVKVIPLFTFLYGLFPINTLRFCHNCDEYFKKHHYERKFTDYWSRFMVTNKAERLVRHFRLAPTFVLSTEEAELTNSVERFQEVGSILGLTTICTSRRIIEMNDGEIDDEAHREHTSVDHAKPHGMLPKESTYDTTKSSGNEDPLETHKETGANAQPTTVTELASGVSLHPDKLTSAALLNLGPEGISNRDPRQTNQNPLFERRLIEHRQAFEMHASDSIGHWRRELLLIRTELAFANFSRDMSEQRALRWQKRAADRMILLSKSESLGRENSSLRGQISALKEEVTRAVRAARNILRERSAYEAKVLERNREYRDKVQKLEEQILDLQTQAEVVKSERMVAEERAAKARREYVKLEEQLKILKVDTDATNRSKSIMESNDAARNQLVDELNLRKKELKRAMERIRVLEWSIDRLEQDHARNIIALEKEVFEAQNAFTVAQTEREASSSNVPNPSIHPTNSRSEEKDQRRRLKLMNEDLTRRCTALEHELRARKVHEEERLNELQSAILSSRSYKVHSTAENRFKGRGGAQGVLNWR